MNGATLNVVPFEEEGDSYKFVTEVSIFKDQYTGTFERSSNVESVVQFRPFMVWRWALAFVRWLRAVWLRHPPRADRRRDADAAGHGIQVYRVKRFPSGWGPTRPIPGPNP